MNCSGWKCGFSPIIPTVVSPLLALGSLLHGLLLSASLKLLPCLTPPIIKILCELSFLLEMNWS